MSHPIYRVSSLGRPLDPRYSSNLLVIAGSVAAGLAVGLYNLSAAVALETSPLVAAVGVFLAWAIGRELDPDRTAVAALAMAIALAALLVGPAELMVGAGALAATRVISGTVGAPLHGLDLLALVGLAALLGAGGITAVALPGLLLAAAVGAADRRQAALLAAGMTFAAAAGALVARPSLVWAVGPGAGLIMLALALAVVVVRIPVGSVASPCDLGGRLSPRRIATARLVASGTVAVGFLLGGGNGVVAAFPTAGAAAVAAGVIGFASRNRTASRAEIQEPATDD